jgi:ArsR family transcriptional regulator
MRAMGNPVRILMVNALSRGDQDTAALCRLARINQSNISRHLTVLRKAGIITDRRAGVRVIYHLEAPAVLRALSSATEVLRADSRKRSEIVTPAHA